MGGGGEAQDRERGDRAAGLAEAHVEVEHGLELEVLEQARVGGLGRAVAGEQARACRSGAMRGGDGRGGGRDQAVADVAEPVLARAEREPGEDRDLAAAEACASASSGSLRRVARRARAAMTSALRLTPSGSRPVPGPASSAGSLAGQPAGEAGRGRRVADAHLAADEHRDAVRLRALAASSRPVLIAVRTSSR